MRPGSRAWRLVLLAVLALVSACGESNGASAEDSASASTDVANFNVADAVSVDDAGPSQDGGQDQEDTSHVDAVDVVPDVEPVADVSEPNEVLDELLERATLLANDRRKAKLSAELSTGLSTSPWAKILVPRRTLQSRRIQG